MIAQKRLNRAQQVMFLRNQIKAREAELRVTQSTIIDQQRELIELRVELGKVKKKGEEELAAANNGWASIYEDKAKQADTNRKDAAAAKQRLDSLLTYTKLALKACQRGRRQKRKAKSLAQARTMLEAAIEEDGLLVWETMPKDQKAVISGAIVGIGVGLAAMMGWFGSKATKEKATT